MPCDLVGCVGDGIDTSAGAYTVDDVDLVFPAGLFGVDLARAYRSDRTNSGWLGIGWATVYDTTLSDASGNVTLNAPVGLAPMWRPEAPAGWAVAGEPAVTRTPTGTELVWPTGETWSFDTTGTLVRLTSPYGQSVTIERTNGVPTAIRSSQGPTISFATADGRVTKATTSDGRSVSFVYRDGVLASVRAPGVSTSYAYNADGLMIERAGPEGVTHTAYENGVVANQVPASGTRVELTYHGGTTTATSEETLHYEHDSGGRLIRVSSGDNDITRRRFDTSGRLIEATDFAQPGQLLVRSLKRTYEHGRVTQEALNGITTDIDYDEQGRVVTVSSGDETTTFDYAADGPLPTAVVTPSHGRNEIDYSHGSVVGVVDANGRRTTTLRDTVGNPIGRATGNQGPWTYDFDAEGNITSMTAPSGRVWTATWGPRSQLLSERDPLGRESTYAYDGAGHLIKEQLPGRPARTLRYNSVGQLVEEIAPDGEVTRYEYDSSGALAATIKPGERVWRTSTQLDGTGGHTVTVTAPDGSYTVARLDSLGRELERGTYEADGTLVELQRSAFTFDVVTTTITTRGTSRLESTTNYDDLGRVIAVTDVVDGQQINNVDYTYVHGLLVSATNGTAVADYSYDPAGRLLRVTAGSDTWEATYRAGQLITTTHNGDTTTIDYDVDGRATTFTDPSGVTTQWTFDAVDRPATRAIGNSTATFDWSTGDQLLAYHAPDGSRWTWNYDDAGRLTSAIEPGGAETSYTYELGTVTDIRSQGGGHDRHDTFDYDARGNLRAADTEAGKHTYTYDATGLVSSIDNKEHWTYDAAHRLATATADSDRYRILYDDQGHIAQIQSPDQSLLATWSATGLTSVDVPDRDPLHISTDADGRLTSVRWDNKTAVDITWAPAGNSFQIRQEGTDHQQAYEISNGYLATYVDQDVHVAATRQPSGYLNSLTLEQTKEGKTGQIKFDHLGRPATLTSDGTAATISYDTDGRVAGVLTSRPGKESEQTVVTYNEGKQKISGDKNIIEALFTSDGAPRSPLPSSLINPLSATATSDDIAALTTFEDPDLLVAPEPQPFSDLASSINDATPDTPSPIGIRDLKKLAERMVSAEVSRLAPTVRVNGAQVVHVPIIDPNSGKIADYNPFVDAAASGTALGELNRFAGGGESLLDRARNTLGDIIGGVVDFAKDIAHFFISNPIARLLVEEHVLVIGAAACFSSGNLACQLVLVVSAALVATDSVRTLISSLPAAYRSCTGGRLKECGLAVAVSAVALEALAAAVTVGFVALDVVRSGPVLAPYGGPGGGHHVLARSAFNGAPGYDANSALAISNEEMARLGISHAQVTAAQATLYREFAASGKTLTTWRMAWIEGRALVAGGASGGQSAWMVIGALADLRSMGVSGPTRIPWGGG